MVRVRVKGVVEVPLIGRVPALAVALPVVIDTAEVTVAMLLIADEVRALAVSHHHAHLEEL